MVNDACEEILKLNQRPTIKRIRSIIGSGSETTIGKMLKIHVQEKEKEEMLEKYEVKISDGILVLVKRMLIEGQQDLLVREGLLQEKVNDLNKQMNDLMEENISFVERAKELEAVLDNCERKHASMEEELNAKKSKIKELSSLEKTNIELSTHLQITKEQLKELMPLKEENVKLATRLESAKEQIEELKKSKEKVEKSKTNP